MSVPSKKEVEDTVKKGTSLRNVDLHDTDLQGANLMHADLQGANLMHADLRGANLRDTNLIGANLQVANLRGADLIGAILCSANLNHADLRDANLMCTNLRNANLMDANLMDANLRVTNLTGTDLTSANLKVKTPPLNSHQFIAEILWRESKEKSQKDFASHIRLATNICWDGFVRLAQSKGVDGWAKNILSKWDMYKNKISKVEDVIKRGTKYFI